MKEYRICENENGKYKLQKRTKFLKLFPVWLSYGKTEYNTIPPIHNTTIYDTEKEALLSLEEIKDREAMELKDNIWKCKALL